MIDWKPYGNKQAFINVITWQISVINYFVRRTQEMIMALCRNDGFQAAMKASTLSFDFISENSV